MTEADILISTDPRVVLSSLVKEEKANQTHKMVITWALGKLKESGLDRKTRLGRSYSTVNDLYFGASHFGRDRSYESYYAAGYSFNTLQSTLIDPIMNRLIDRMPLVREFNYLNIKSVGKDTSYSVQEYRGIDYAKGFSRVCTIGRYGSDTLTINVVYFDMLRDFKVLSRYIRNLNRLIIRAKIPLTVKLFRNTYDAVNSDARNIPSSPTPIIPRNHLSIQISMDNTYLPDRIVVNRDEPISPRNHLWLVKLYGNINSLVKICQTLTRLSVENMGKRLESMDTTKEQPCR